MLKRLRRAKKEALADDRAGLTQMVIGDVVDKRFSVQAPEEMKAEEEDVEFPENYTVTCLVDLKANLSENILAYKPTP